MAGRGAPSARPIWVKQAEEAKVKEEEEKAAAARAAFDATFKDVDAGAGETLVEEDGDDGGSESEKDEAQELAKKPIGPVDPGKCTAAGTGVAGGAAGAAASFVIVTKDEDGRRVQEGGAHIRVKVMPGVGVSGGGVEQEAVVKDHGDGTYTVTYAVAKRGDYMVSVECNGLPINNSPFPVFFSGVTAPIPLSSPGTLLTASPFVNGIGQSPFPGVMSGIFPANYGLIPGAAGANMAGLSQMPLPPSAAAMAAAQTIMVARAYEAAQARAAAAQESSALKESEKDVALSEEKQKELLSRTLQVSNLSPLLSADQLKTLFGYCGTVSECKINESKQFAYVEYAKPEEAKAALALNNMEVGGRPINVEMAKSLPSKKPPAGPAANGLPVMMQQAVAMQQYQFQQALLVQQAVASQQAALQAATVKSASEMAAARAAEISKSLKGSGNDQEEKDSSAVKRSPSRPRQSRSRSPIRYRRHHRSRSLSRSPNRFRRGRRSRSRSRDRYRHVSDGRDRARFYRGGEEFFRSQTRYFRDRDRERHHEPRSSRRSRSPSRSKRRSGGSRSPRTRKDRSHSPPRQRTTERSENARSSHTRSRIKEGHQNETGDGECVEKTSFRRDETKLPSMSKDKKNFNEHWRLSKSPSKELGPGLGEIPESGGGKMAFEHDFEVKQPVNESGKVSEDDVKGEDDFKEKRGFKKKHRRDEDCEKRDKRRKGHKHRPCKSPSDSANGLPSVDGGKSRVDSDDASGPKKSHKKTISASYSNSGSD